MDDFNYFDFIGCGESCLFPLIGIVFSPVLFPLYLVLKVITILLDFLMDVFDGLFTIKKSSNVNKSKNNSEEKTKVYSEVDSLKKEQLQKKIEELKQQKRIIEEQIKKQEQELGTKVNPQNMQIINEVEPSKVEDKPKTLVLKR